MRGLKSTAMDDQVPLGKRLLAVDGDAGLPQARCIGHPDHPAVPEKPQRGIPLVSPGSHRPGAAPVLPARRLQIQQVHEIGFAGLAILEFRHAKSSFYIDSIYHTKHACL